ncbi:MAG: hypothetical protein JWN73_2685 [Betaproteobacteria bacterium]|nr:hypothetical protein [Betaproteobacteria bacterium]
MSVQNERRKAMICGPIVFRNALGTRRSLPTGPCELAVASHGVQRVILKIGEVELDYHFSQSYIDECVRNSPLVVERLEHAAPACRTQNAYAKAREDLPESPTWRRQTGKTGVLGLVKP